MDPWHLPMKKSLPPLLGVAFVIAIISTGVFYGLFAEALTASAASPVGYVLLSAKSLPVGHTLKEADLKRVAWSGSTLPKGALASPTDAVGLTLLAAVEEGELLTAHRTIASGAGAGAALGVPTGFRAVSIRVSDSPGVVALLKPGHWVDVQSIGRSRDRNRPETSIRTLLQRLSVLRVAPFPDGQAGRAVVTLLADPRQADVLSLADASSQLRLLLRNPVDNPEPVSAPVQADPEQRRAPGAPGMAAASFLVRVVHAEPAGWTGTQDKSKDVRRLDPQRSTDSLLRSLSAQRQGQVLATFRLGAQNGQEVTALVGRGRAGTDDTGLRLRLLPTLRSPGILHLRLQPEATIPVSEGYRVHRRRSELELADGDTILVRGFANAEQAASLVHTLFPDTPPSSTSRELYFLITTCLRPTTSAGF